MLALDLIMFSFPIGTDRVDQSQKKTDVAEHPEVFDHVGLLFDKPSSRNSAGMPFI
jgi:hypothetical protein